MMSYNGKKTIILHLPSGETVKLEPGESYEFDSRIMEKLEDSQKFIQLQEDNLIKFTKKPKETSETTATKETAAKVSATAKKA